MRRNPAPLIMLLLAGLSLLSGCGDPAPRSGEVQDEAKRAGRDAASFPAAAEDYFHDMDNGVALTPDEAAGRDMWIVWTGGDDRFWDVMTLKTFGAFDLLKLVTSHPKQQFPHDGAYAGQQKPLTRRESRWREVGLINEPCYEQPTAPDPKRFGLYLDVRGKDCPPDPFEDETKYPGVAIGARGATFSDGKTLPVGSYYGYATGIVGLRLFPNPAFDEKAEKHWDPERYYTDPAYYNDPNLVRPYRVGMSCGFCHVGPSPIHPPADPAHPRWSELNSTVGAQYLWVDKIFADNSAIGTQPDSQRRNFVYQLVHTYRPGTMDTSLVSTDSINNPRTMNAIYSAWSRLLPLAKEHGKETLGPDDALNKQFNQYAVLAGSPLNTLYATPDTVWTPRVLKDGSDSVGVLGALNRVYLNIGLFSEEWLLHFNAVVGGKPITPIEIAVAEKNSPYWQATEAGTPAMALFLLRAGQPDKLADAPGGSRYLTAADTVIDRGKTVFAETCARCHSSKAPTPPADADAGACAGPHYLECWGRYWAWTKTEDFKSKMREIVHRPDFLDGNYLSSELRAPVTLLRTNACSPLATNAIAGNIWDNFSSQTYKDLPSVGAVSYHDPITGAEKTYQMAAGATPGRRR
jgi:cytochrome c2